MTAQQSLTNKNHIVTPRYIVYTLTHTWAIILLAFIVLFFTMTVAPMLTLSDADDGYSSSDKYEERMISTAEDTAYGVSCAVVIEAFAFGLFAGISNSSFLHDKTASGFYHSLPEKRSGHFIASLLSSCTVFILPLLLNTVLMTVVFGFYGVMTAMVMTSIVRAALFGLLYYLYSIASTFLASMLTGTRVMSLIVSLFITNAPAVLYGSVSYIICSSLTYLSGDIFGSSIYYSIFPYARAYHLLTAETYGALSVRCIIIEIILTLVLLALSYVAYMKRPIERVGTPIIYKWASAIVKYCVMFVITLLFSEFFKMFNGAWVVFGLASGAVLSLMLSNVILNRSVKMMFSGLKGFAVFAVCFVLFYVGTYAGMFHFIDYIVPNTDEITIALSGTPYTFDGKEADELHPLLVDFVNSVKNGTSSDDDSRYYEESAESYATGVGYQQYYEGDAIDDEINVYGLEETLQNIAEEFEWWDDNSLYVTVTYGNSTDGGFCCTYYYGTQTEGTLSDIINFLKEKTNYGVGNSTVHELNSANWYGITFSVPSSAVSNSSYLQQSFAEAYADEEAPLSMYVTAYFYTKGDASGEFTLDFEIKDEPSIGNITLRVKDTETHDYSYTNLPLYVSDLEQLVDIFSNEENFTYEVLLESSNGYGYYLDSDSVDFERLIQETFGTDYSLSEYAEELVSDYEYAYVYNKTTGKGELVEDDDMAELLECVESASPYATTNAATITEYDYTVIFLYKNTSYRSGEYTTFYVTYFVEDKIPEFLS